MTNKTETPMQYVVRCLKNAAYNNSEASRTTGISNPVLSAILNGKNKNPSQDTVQRLFDYFKNLGAK